MPGADGDCEAAQLIHGDHRRVGGLAAQMGRNRPDGNPHRADEDDLPLRGKGVCRPALQGKRLLRAPAGAGHTSPHGRLQPLRKGKALLCKGEKDGLLSACHFDASRYSVQNVGS